MGEFFKKCLDSSKFLLKPVQKPPPPPPQPPITETPAVKPVEPPAPLPLPPPTVSLGFQEQFLNSLGKLSEGNMVLPIAEEPEEIDCSEKQNVANVDTSQTNVEKMDTEPQNEHNKETTENETATNGKTGDKEIATNEKTEDQETATNGKIKDKESTIESASVIMISDSEDDKNADTEPQGKNNT